jgi:hypothetical protein
MMASNEPFSDLLAFVEERLRLNQADVVHDLLAHIEATDRLIDRIVYRLYGLTEEEVGVVEGRLKHE